MHFEKRAPALIKTDHEEGRHNMTKKTLIATAAIFVVTAILTAADDPKAENSEPVASLVVGPGQGAATPTRVGSARTGAGNIMVTQPAPDTLSVKMTGAVAAKRHPCTDSTGSLVFELSQDFEVVIHSPRVKAARLIMWSRAVGLLRADRGKCDQSGAAEASNPGHASLSCGPQSLLTLDLPTRMAAGGQNLSVYDREGPVWVAVGPGKYTLHQRFGIAAAHAKGLFSKPASAEFAPDALDEAWVGTREPFHGADKKDFGFHVIIKVMADDDTNGKPQAKQLSRR
jgi:hypothetical protein